MDGRAGCDHHDGHERARRRPPRFEPVLRPAGRRPRLTGDLAPGRRPLRAEHVARRCVRLDGSARQVRRACRDRRARRRSGRHLDHLVGAQLPHHVACRPFPGSHSASGERSGCRSVAVAASAAQNSVWASTTGSTRSTSSAPLLSTLFTVVGDRAQFEMLAAALRPSSRSRSDGSATAGSSQRAQADARQHQRHPVVDLGQRAGRRRRDDRAGRQRRPVTAAPELVQAGERDRVAVGRGHVRRLLHRAVRPVDRRHSYQPSAGTRQRRLA